VVGDLTLSYEGLKITSAPGLLMLPYTAEPHSASYDKLQLLANWSATISARDEDRASPSTNPRAAD
jgi:hypothetical protein